MRVFRQCLRLALYLRSSVSLLIPALGQHQPVEMARRKVEHSIGENGPSNAWLFTGSRRTYRIVLFVRRRIHCGMGRFCFAALASFFFVRNDLWLCEGRSIVVSMDTLQLQIVD